MGFEGMTALSWALISGIGIGLFYFGGLWWTVKQLPSRRYPWLWALGSFLVRGGLSVMAFYWITGGRWEQVVMSLGGFLLVRTVMVRRLGLRQAEGL